MQADIVVDLQDRGLLVQSTDLAALVEHLATGPRTVYCGFDPTADSLHIGNLVPLLVLKRFQLAGHRPVLLLGGATGLIGDPSGKSEERNLNDERTVAGFVQRIREQTQHFLTYDGTEGALVVNNLDWTAKQSVLYFLREIGKHFSVNMMMQRESVRARLEREGQGISYTEFSYMLLQANDYLELFDHHACTLQVGGNDQWGNIVSGVDLIRRKRETQVHALTLPLITKADGTKFGKTAGGSIWLDPAKTSPYSFYQFWLNTADQDVVHYLKVFTLLLPVEIEALARMVAEQPGERRAQIRLAEAVTELVHGRDAVAASQRISQALFTGILDDLSAHDLESLRQDGIATTAIVASQVALLEVLIQSRLATSNGAARKLITGGGVSVNGVRVSNAEQQLDWSDALHGSFYLLRKGKKTWHLVHRA